MQAALLVASRAPAAAALGAPLCVRGVSRNGSARLQLLADRRVVRNSLRRDHAVLAMATSSDSKHGVASEAQAPPMLFSNLRVGGARESSKEGFKEQLTVAMALGALALLLPHEASALASGEVMSLAAAEIDPGTAKLAISILGPLFAAFNLLFIVRIVMSWYPQIPVGKFPFSVAYAPTEPVLGPTRRLIPPVGGVDVAPVIWVALMSFANEILLGQQGLLVLLSQQQP